MKDTTNDNINSNISNQLHCVNDTPSLGLDLKCYEQFLEDESITAAEKRELIETLWGIITEVVAIGWGVHPVQQATRDKPCGKSDYHTDSTTHFDNSMVHSTGTGIVETFVAAQGEQVAETTEQEEG